MSPVAHEEERHDNIFQAGVPRDGDSAYAAAAATEQHSMYVLVASEEQLHIYLQQSNNAEQQQGSARSTSSSRNTSRTPDAALATAIESEEHGGARKGNIMVSPMEVNLLR